MLVVLAVGCVECVDGAIVFDDFAAVKYRPPPDLLEKNEYDLRPAAKGGRRRIKGGMAAQVVGGKGGGLFGVVRPNRHQTAYVNKRLAAVQLQAEKHNIVYNYYNITAMRV